LPDYSRYRESDVVKFQFLLAFLVLVSDVFSKGGDNFQVLDCDGHKHYRDCENRYKHETELSIGVKRIVFDGIKKSLKNDRHLNDSHNHTCSQCEVPYPWNSLLKKYFFRPEIDLILGDVLLL